MTTAPVFFATAEQAHSEHRPDTAPIIKIIFGQTGYENTVLTAEEAAQMNENAGHSAGNVEAAVICSMFDCWQNFDKISADHDKRSA